MANKVSQAANFNFGGSNVVKCSQEWDQNIKISQWCTQSVALQLYWLDAPQRTWTRTPIANKIILLPNICSYKPSMRTNQSWHQNTWPMVAHDEACKKQEYSVQIK